MNDTRDDHQLGPVETDELIGAIRDKLRQCMGGRLGASSTAS